MVAFLLFSFDFLWPSVTTGAPQPARDAGHVKPLQRKLQILYINDVIPHIPTTRHAGIITGSSYERITLIEGSELEMPLEVILTWNYGPHRCWIPTLAWCEVSSYSSVVGADVTLTPQLRSDVLSATLYITLFMSAG